MSTSVAQAEANIRNILEHAIRFQDGDDALVIFDTQSSLANILTEAYRAALPNGTFIDFDTVTSTDIFFKLDTMSEGSLVVLVQSTNFRLDEFRIRIELFKRGFKAIEHVHLGRMSSEQEELYIGELTYDPNYYRPLGRTLKAKMDAAQNVVVESGDARLEYVAGMEEAKLNIGHYEGMQNIGGTFPIGEIFTESKDLKMVNGTARIFAFAGKDHNVREYDPFLITVKDGVVVETDGPEEFKEILKLIAEDEEILLREFGLGLNPAVGKGRIVNDITAFERQKGLHFSLGAKHSMYAKPGIRRRDGRYHIDIFVDVSRITADGDVIYQDGEFCV